MSNFAFLPPEFRAIQDAATQAEGHIWGDPRAACFHARFTLEAIVHWLYRHDRELHHPYDNNLSALLHATSFQNRVPQSVYLKARLIQQQGNDAVHHPRPVRTQDALQVVQELHQVCYWLVRTYTPEASRAGAAWKEERIPPAPNSPEVVPRKDLEALEQRLAEQNAEALKRQQERDALDSQLQALRVQLAEVRAAAEQVPDAHDYGEAETRRYLVDTALTRTGWSLDPSPGGLPVREVEVTGMPTATGSGYADYVLWGEDGQPLAVIEAKKTTLDPHVGQQQAKLYADGLEQMHGQRPLIFTTNGYSIWLWDDTHYPPRQVSGFYTQDALQRLILRRSQRQALDVRQIKDAIAGRYYQKRAIGSLFDLFTQARRKALLVMATGTGKTRTTIALVDVLQRAAWIKRALFLADRVSLVKQACNAFKTHLPDSSPVNLVTEKATEGRVYVCTYPTMMGMINQGRFTVGDFDLIIIDEAHRSVYQKYGAIFAYFDALLVGLTATPREEVDKNTYTLIELEPGVPTDAYELEEAVNDGFLVPPKVQQVDLRFPREGIDYESLSDEEKAQWEAIDWGDDAEGETLPDRVNAAAINSWLFNQDTVDQGLQHLMEHGHKVAGGDRLAKTLIFARNHHHAAFIEQRFNHHYPHLKGQFARVIDNQVAYAQSLIDDFAQTERLPQIAISVDMLDTGIDIPEIANLVFFKPVYSKIKFWQMIGRGTRLCPDLFGPGEDKQDFRVFDFCFNFDFFREHPEGINTRDSVPLGTRLFRSRVQLLGHLQTTPELDPDADVQITLSDDLHAEVAAMNQDNFIVRQHLESVERFQQRPLWDDLTEQDRETLQREIAGLPSERETDDLESRLFDLTALNMQLAQAEGDLTTFERHRQRVVEMAMRLEDKRAIPVVEAQLAYLAELQDSAYWEDITLVELEQMRLRLRLLMPFLDKKERKIVYTNFKDEVLGVRDEAAIAIPKMTGVQYEKKEKAYLNSHLNNIVIHRLRTHQALTATDLQNLEATLVKIGADEGQTLLSGLLQRSSAPSLVHFVRSLVGMDRQAAQEVFAQFLNDRSLNATQIRFIELIIDQLTARGVMDAAALYEPPFSHLHAGGPDELFAGRENVIDGVFETLKQLDPEQLSVAA
jgi:type I restriction enzyme R subunit